MDQLFTLLIPWPARDFNPVTDTFVCYLPSFEDKLLFILQHH